MVWLCAWCIVHTHAGETQCVNYNMCVWERREEAVPSLDVDSNKAALVRQWHTWTPHKCIGIKAFLYCGHYVAN